MDGLQSISLSLSQRASNTTQTRTNKNNNNKINTRKRQANNIPQERELLLCFSTPWDLVGGGCTCREGGLGSFLFFVYSGTSPGSVQFSLSLFLSLSLSLSHCRPVVSRAVRHKNWRVINYLPQQQQQQSTDATCYVSSCWFSLPDCGFFLSFTQLWGL